jgi:aminoglycoside phosphotransferase (APT) family kinase protein
MTQPVAPTLTPAALNLDSLIPESHQSAVARAIKQAFGRDTFEDIRILTAGMSPARIYRIVVDGHPYLLRVILNTAAPSGPGQGDPTRHYTAMRAAAQFRLAPRVHYTSIEDGVSITDFIDAHPLPLDEAALYIPATLRAVHALPAFPRTVNYLDAVDNFAHRFQAAKILPESDTAEFFAQYARVAAAYPRTESDLVSSHNDLKPENVLFDGNRVWLVDWEAAFLNDRYFDLAVVANFVLAREADTEAYLHTYFGEAPGPYRRARFYLMRQITHMSYAAVFMLIGSRGKTLSPAPPPPDFRDFHNRIWSGEISLVPNAVKLQYAFTHMHQFLANTRSPHFEDALGIVANHPAPA